MSDHLPECMAVGVNPRNDEWVACICDRLRAAEQRGHGEAMLNHYGPAYDRGREAGVEAAREAVANARMHDVRDRFVAVAAIDALEKP